MKAASAVHLAPLWPLRLHCCCMRRFFAIFLLTVFGSFLGAPLLASSSDVESNLPACCRRDGKHHCMMQSGTPAFSFEKTLARKGEKCPCFPGAIPGVRCQLHALPASARSYAALVSYPACNLRTEACRPISFDRGHHKRGPPVIA
jgi:hypothetical protein